MVTSLKDISIPLISAVVLLVWPMIRSVAMHLDVQELRNFYYRQALGRAVQRSLRATVLKIWPDTTGQTVVGFGFAVPLLRPFLAK